MAHFPWDPFGGAIYVTSAHWAEMKPWRITRWRRHLQHTKECTCSWMVDIYLWQSHVFADIYKCGCGTLLLTLLSQASVKGHLGCLLEILQILMKLLRSSEHFACSSGSAAQESQKVSELLSRSFLSSWLTLCAPFSAFTFWLGIRGLEIPFTQNQITKKSYSSAPF